MKRWVHTITASNDEAQDSKYAIALVEDSTGDILGYASGYRRGGFYHPGDVIQCTRGEADEWSRVFDDATKAKRVLAQYRNYSEAYIYDPDSADYPMPSEELKRKEVKTHLEVVEV